MTMTVWLTATQLAAIPETLTMTRWIRQSLLVQMISLYLVFALVVLGAGLVVNAVLEGQLRGQVQSADLALAQETALETRDSLVSAERSVEELSRLGAVRSGDQVAMIEDFQAFRAARSDVDHVYWINTFGELLLAVPSEGVTLLSQFEPPDVIQRALLPQTVSAVMEVGVAHAPMFDPGVTIAQPVRDSQGQLRGIVAASLSLAEMSAPLKTVVSAQAKQRHNLIIRILDNLGELVASSTDERMLNTMTDELPGASAALSGQATTLEGPGPGNVTWLYSAAPVAMVNWAVVVQRPSGEALSVISSFRLWLLLAALLFAAGVALLWMAVLERVIQPLRTLSLVHQGARPSAGIVTGRARELTRRQDEMGGLARSLERLERDVALQLSELQTLLQTSSAVVSTLDPRAVAETIIHEVGRLVNVQAATVLAPDESGTLRVLASDGRSDDYVRTHQRQPNDPHSPAALALREGRVVQLLAGDVDVDPQMRTFPVKAYEEGFRSMLAAPIISRHAGGVVLLVHRTRAIPFSEDEVNLLLTFANYATLAWEHAVLYERSDERLREVASENARLYQQAAAEKQTLAAIMGSMSDGLALTGVDGAILYANRGAAAITGVASEALERGHISDLYAALRQSAVDSTAAATQLEKAAPGSPADLTLEISRGGQNRAIRLRLFDVLDDSGEVIGRGLLLRDVTREREVDEMKTTLLAAVGHELRTPLSVIKGHASTLLADDVVWSPEDQRHSLGIISAESDRLADLVANLLDLTRVEAGLLPLHLATCAVDDLIAGAIQRLWRPASAVEIAIEPDTPAVLVDGARIEVVLRNLLANALVYGGQHVRVRAGRVADTSEVAITVSDDGPGVAPEDVPHLFERFYRARRGEGRSGGAGIGLAISKAFVEAHGGAIHAWLDETGMSIRLTLPSAPDAPGAEPAAPAASIPGDA
ncbi:MAG TPA: ATP-binding protein [Ktedonobacterales bacterium]